MLDWKKALLPGVLEDGTIQVCDVEGEVAAQITGMCGEDVLRCFIDPEILKAIAADNAMATEDVLRNYLPKKPHIRSGDVGEILTWWLIPKEPPGITFPLYRWRLKGAPDSPVQGIDLVGFFRAGEEPDPEDILLLVEVKTRAKKPNRKIVRKAYAGVTKDFTSRLAEQLLVQQKSLREQGNVEAAQTIARFRNPHAHPHKTIVSAVVVHEAKTWREDFLRELPARHDLKVQVDVRIVAVRELHSLVQRVLNAALAAAREMGE